MYVSCSIYFILLQTLAIKLMFLAAVSGMHVLTLSCLNIFTENCKIPPRTLCSDLIRRERVKMNTDI